MSQQNETIVDRLLRAAKTCPDRPVYIELSSADETGRITYRELQTCVLRKAGELSGSEVLGLSGSEVAGKCALLMYRDTVEFITTFLACLVAGIIPVPVSSGRGKAHQDRWRRIYTDAGTACLLTDDDQVSTEVRTIRLVNGDSSSPVKEQGSAHWFQQDIACIQYTSGSTSDPKGVVISHANLMHNQQLIQDTFGTGPESIILSWLPFHHDMGLFGNLLHAIYCGCTCYLMPPADFIKSPLGWLKAISVYRVTHSGGPNFAYDLCVEKCSPDLLAGIDLSSWEVAYNGAEPVKPGTMEKFYDRFKAAGFRNGVMRVCYGLAEATLLVSAARKSTDSGGGGVQTGPGVTPADRTRSGGIGGLQTGPGGKVVSCGPVSRGMECRIVSVESQQPCDELSEGEICISGPSVTAGYWNRNTHSLFVKIDGTSYLRTGDLGFLYQGELYVNGRLKEMIIVRGRNYYPYDMETAMSDGDSVIEPNGVAVFGWDEGEGKIVIAAEIRRLSMATLDPRRTIQRMDQLFRGSVGIEPHDILLLRPFGIPRTTSGKIRRSGCREYYDRGLFPVIISKRQLPPENGGEKARDPLLGAKALESGAKADIVPYLLDIIGQRTGQLSLPPDLATDLTAAGLDSLRIVELVSQVGKELRIPIDITQVQANPTLGGLATTIESLLWITRKRVSDKQISI